MATVRRLESGTQNLRLLNSRVGYAFRAVISNQASFAQVYPNIQLVLQDYTGRPFAQRIFRPQDYLSENGVTTKMIPDATIAISLEIAAPKTGIGGYNFELTY